MTQTNSRAVFEAFRGVDNDSKLESIIKSILTEKRTDSSSSRMPPFMVPYDAAGRISSLWAKSTDAERKELMELVESCVRVGGDRRRVETAIQVRLGLWIVKQQKAQKSAARQRSADSASDARPPKDSKPDRYAFPDTWVPFDDSNQLRKAWTKLEDERKLILLEKVKSAFPSEFPADAKSRLVQLFQNMSQKGTDVETYSEEQARIPSSSSAHADERMLSPDDEETVESGIWEADEIMNVRLEKASDSSNEPRKVSILVRLSEGPTVWVDADLLLSSRIVENLRETLLRIR
jgi:hypothetical protein